MARTASFLGLVLFGIGITVACEEAEERKAGPGFSPAPTTITLLIQSDERVWNPSNSLPAQQLVFAPLFHDDGNGPEGRLVRSWEVSEDGKSWTYHLRNDVYWHDGVPMTAADVAFTVRLLSNPAVSFFDPQDLQVQVLDDSTVVFRYEGPTWLRPLDTWYVFYPKHLLEGLDPSQFNDWDFWERPTGNGPYRYVRHVPKTMVELEANPDYFRERPKIDRVILKFGGSKITELLAGNVDLVEGVTPTEWATLASYAEFERYYTFTGSAHMVFWNHRDPIFSHAEVRKALSMAVDRRTLHGLLGLPQELPTLDLLVSERQFLTGDFPMARSSDLEGAQRMLEEAGWQDEDGDGIRERDGVELAFTLLGRLWEEVPVFLQDQWRRVGAKVEIQPLEPSLAVPRFRAGEFQATVAGSPRNMEAALRVVGCGDVSDCSRGQPPGPTGYWDAELAELVDDMDADIASGAIEDAYRSAWATLKRDEPIAVLAPMIWQAVAHHRVRGLSSPFRLDPEIHMEELWIAEGTEAGRDSSRSSVER